MARRIPKHQQQQMLARFMTDPSIRERVANYQLPDGTSALDALDATVERESGFNPADHVREDCDS